MLLLNNVTGYLSYRARFSSCAIG